MLSVGHKNLTKTTFRIAANIMPTSIITKSIIKRIVQTKCAMCKLILQPINRYITSDVKESINAVIAVQIKMNPTNSWKGKG